MYMIRDFAKISQRDLNHVYKNNYSLSNSIY